MALPDREQVKSWGGKMLVDRTGQVIGSVTQIYTDDDTGLPEWATTRLGEATVYLPLLDAVEADGRIRVPVHRDDVAKAPLVVDRRHISPDDEVRLYRHYGIPYSPDRSHSGLPRGEGPLRARLRTTTASARTAASTMGRRFADPPTIALTGFALLLAIRLAVLLRRRRSRG